LTVSANRSIKTGCRGLLPENNGDTSNTCLINRAIPDTFARIYHKYDLYPLVVFGIDGDIDDADDEQE
jgi:hypothetical protein